MRCSWTRNRSSLRRQKFASPSRMKMSTEQKRRMRGPGKKTHCCKGHPLDRDDSFYTDPKTGMRRCAMCRKFKNTDPSERQKRIDATKRWRLRNPNAVKHYDVISKLRNYGLTPSQYDSILESQGGKCAICKRKCSRYKNLSVDHDHSTGSVRGLLCCTCNPALGLFKDSPELLLAASEYIKKNQPLNTALQYNG